MQTRSAAALSPSRHFRLAHFSTSAELSSCFSLELLLLFFFFHRLDRISFFIYKTNMRRISERFGGGNHRIFVYAMRNARRDFSRLGKCHEKNHRIKGIHLTFLEWRAIRLRTKELIWFFRFWVLFGCSHCRMSLCSNTSFFSFTCGALNHSQFQCEASRSEAISRSRRNAADEIATIKRWLNHNNEVALRWTMQTQCSCQRHCVGAMWPKPVAKSRVLNFRELISRKIEFSFFSRCDRHTVRPDSRLADDLRVCVRVSFYVDPAQQTVQ